MNGNSGNNALPAHSRLAVADDEGTGSHLSAWSAYRQATDPSDLRGLTYQTDKSPVARDAGQPLTVVGA
jgi:hypothetical protein